MAKRITLYIDPPFSKGIWITRGANTFCVQNGREAPDDIIPWLRSQYPEHNFSDKPPGQAAVPEKTGEPDNGKTDGDGISAYATEAYGELDLPALRRAIREKRDSGDLDMDEVINAGLMTDSNLTVLQSYKKYPKEKLLEILSLAQEG